DFLPFRPATRGGEGTTPSLPGLTGTTYTNTGLTNGTTYFYQVTAVNAGGQSSTSNEASATPQVALPPAPTGLTAAAGNAQVTLSWNSVSGATSYTVYRSTASVAETLLQSGLTTAPFTDTGPTTR